jgi:hypothetical protein
MMGPRARLGTCLAIATISAAAASSAACSKAPAEKRALDRRTEAARVQRNTELLQRQLELAAGKEFYLVLDPATSGLTLMLRGALLQRYAVLGLQVGHPRTAWFGERNPRTLQGVVWTHGELDPPRQIDRLVIQAGEPGKEAVDAATPPIPPTPEEMYPVPSRYRVRFGEGLSVEIRPREADATAGRWTSLRAAWSAKWRDALAAVRTRDRDAVRLRVVLNPKDAESLYRSLPPDLKLIVLAGGGEAAPSPEPPRGSAQDPAK